jgi:uncharacterized membrane protein YtjA (UPF0391 family)
MAKTATFFGLRRRAAHHAHCRRREFPPGRLRTLLGQDSVSSFRAAGPATLDPPPPTVPRPRASAFKTHQFRRLFVVLATHVSAVGTSPQRNLSTAPNIVSSSELCLENRVMLRWALIFLVISLIAALFGFTGISAAAAGIAKILFFLFVVITLVFFALALSAWRALR